MPDQPWTPFRINAWANAYWSSCALHAAVRLGLLAELSPGQATAAQLARRLELDPRALGMLLGALAATGLLVKEDDKYQVHPEAQPYFTPGDDQDLSNIILHNANLVPKWARLHECIKTGRPVPGTRGPEERAAFYKGMRDISRQQSQELAARLGLTAGQRLLDLGGGPGVYGYTFADEVPGLVVTVLDLPDSEPYFLAEAEGRPQARNVGRINGDYRQADLGGPYDVVWLSHVLHGEGPTEAARLVARAARALKPGGALWVQEFVAKPGAPQPALFALTMLVNTESGQTYTAGELFGFMAAAGFADMELMGPTTPGAPASLLKAIKPA